ncbi:MAG: FkbM family methyltransferase [Geobacteraceae bacterium]|nr:FkbM family methyltransferase [Geobacteraceae bacterium]NTW79400.1 FkbM family methyltransferase [Geobacteraceae bacterium]
MPDDLRQLIPPGFSNCSTGYKEIAFPGDNQSRTIDFEFLNIPQPIIAVLRKQFSQIRFNNEIMDRVNARLRELPDQFVGVHARTWFDEPERRLKWFDFDAFVTVCSRFQDKEIFVTCDDPDFIDRLSRAMNKKLITMKGSGRRVPKPWQQNSREEMLDDIVELLILSKASQLVLTAMSTYSEVAWYFGGCTDEVYFADPDFRQKGHADSVRQPVSSSVTSGEGDVYWIEVSGTPSYHLALIPGLHVHLDSLDKGVHKIGDYVEKYSGYMKGSAADDYMIDVGANLGLSAFPVASIQRRVVAFEPVADNNEAMKKSIVRNRFDNVTLIECAVSSQVGETNIYVPQGRADNSSFGEDVANANVSSPEVYKFQVPTETIDHWSEVHGKEFSPGDAKLLKIDVQGYETAVFLGAKNFIAACRPFEKLIIEFEFDPKLTQMAGYSTVGLLKLIHSYGLEIYCNGTQIPSDYYADFCRQDINCDLIALFRPAANSGCVYTGVMNMGDSLYRQDFYNSQILGSLQSAQVYLYHLFSIWGVPESIADIGCGRGAWLATCLDFGVKRVVGVDGDWNSQEAMLDSNIEFHSVNLEKRFTLTGPFDLAISLEVAEHLQPESSDTFVESLSSLSDAVLFGAAFIGQPGVNHINTRLHSFWAGKFFERGYVLFDLFRPIFWNDDRIEPCYRQNTFVYVKPGHSLYQALLNGGYEPDREGRMIDCVHPAVYIGLVIEYNKLQQTLTADQAERSLPDINDCGDINGIDPDKSGAIEQLIEHAEAQVTMNRLGDAADTYRLALAQEPNNPECLLRLSHVLLLMKCYGECFHHARHFIRLVDDIALGYFIAGYAAREIGRWRESRSYLLRAVELDPSHMYARVLCCMSLFTVCMDETEVESILHSYVAELDQLVRNTALETPEQIDNAVDGIGALAPFFLPYLGCNVKNLQTKYGSWICSTMAAKYPHFTYPLPQRSSNGKIKIAIVSNYFYNHSNWKIPIRGWLEQLDRQLFSIHCFHTGEVSDMATESARSLADSFLQCSDTEALAAAIHEQDFDVLIYPGIGMETTTLKLAALRLAPVQCTSWGHPVTTGMPTVDYFISSDLMEPADGDEHYTEKLVRLPNLSIWYEPAESKRDVVSALPIPGLEKDDVMFLCSQNLLKYLPQYDFVFPAIASQVANARFVFIAGYVAELTDKFIQRLELAFQSRGLNAVDHVTVLPQLDEAGFLALNARADIILDSIEWSGCNTIFESLPFSKPIVTMPGRFMRGRHAYAILEMIGVKETIAASVKEYIDIAIRLAQDPQWRDEISARIFRNKYRIYQDRECIKGLEMFLMDVSGRKSTVVGG